MHISEFDYDLPAELIAQQPLARRDASRMLVIDRETESWFDSEFCLLPGFVNANDTVVINNTKVFPARLIGHRHPSGGRVEVMLVRQLGRLRWEALVRPSQRLKKGARLQFGGARLSAEMLDEPGTELRLLKFDSSEPINDVLAQIGHTPLPPYIKRDEGEMVSDRDRYQTIFARNRGAIAAPTAGLHFSETTIEALLAKGTSIAEITLHVGYGTFAPVRVEEVESHSVAAENFSLTQQTSDLLNRTRRAGGRVIAVGTTSVRALESSVNEKGEIVPCCTNTELTITPGYDFRATDALLTNFHLPRSSLLLLVSAFAGRELLLRAYRHAVDQRYRFYSYGDCMLIR
ncbi:MAG TPA: tRNA preQ1(34) S-adenosylmethionine ribosyltransferase-isomerase QueA [Pyrinomonadaceae bacterium]